MERRFEHRAEAARWWLGVALLGLGLVGCQATGSHDAPAEASARRDLSFTEPAEAPQPPAARLTSAISVLQSGDAEGALAALDGLLEARPDFGMAWLYRGAALEQLGRLEASREAFDKALADDASAPMAMLALARFLLRDGDLDGAFDWLRQAQQSRRVDVTQICVDPRYAALKEDPRMQALMPTPDQWERPFVEQARVLQRWDGEGEGDQFGWIARNVGDVDGDGIADVTTSAPTRALGDLTAAGRIYVYSGSSGALLWNADGAVTQARLGIGVEAAGDVDADGIPDVIAGAPGADRSFVYAGDDGRVLLELEASQPGEAFGRTVSDVGDLDGDGHDDLLIGAPSNDAHGEDAGRAGVYSGKDGRLLHEWFGDAAGQRFGAAVAGVAGSSPRVAIGAPDAGANRGGRVYVYRGLSDEPAFTIETDASGAELGGMFISIVGDIDADGDADVYASDWSNNARGGSTGRVYVHSGVDGRRLLSLTGEAPGDGFGIGPADAGDVDGDGHADLIIGAWQHGSAAPSGGKVYLFSGRDGALLREITCRTDGDTFGFDATGMGDVDGDGKIDFLLTSAWSAINGARSGRVFLIAGR